MSSPSLPPTSSERPDATVADYDEDNYDYRTFWTGRDYEHWAEERVVRRLLNRIGHTDWLIDLGGGFGRHIPTYQRYADHAILLDYSWTNLRNAQRALMGDKPADTRLYLIRGNLYHLPFRTAAFPVGMTTRVIHHLRAIDEALTEMGRVLGQAWVLDVPIKNHLLARARAMSPSKRARLRDKRPNEIGTADTPFLNFHMDAIRERLQADGWSTSLAASVNNFRRWNRVLRGPLEAPARPVVNTLEVAAQRVGRGWWGPAQFLWLTRNPPMQPTLAPEATYADLPEPWRTLAPRMWCPQCHADLRWTADAATCDACAKTYARDGAIWDFVVA